MCIPYHTVANAGILCVYDQFCTSHPYAGCNLHVCISYRSCTVYVTNFTISTLRYHLLYSHCHFLHSWSPTHLNWSPFLWRTRELSTGCQPCHFLNVSINVRIIDHRNYVNCACFFFFVHVGVVMFMIARQQLF